MVVLNFGDSNIGLPKSETPSFLSCLFYPKKVTKRLVGMNEIFVTSKSKVNVVTEGERT